MKVCNGIIAAAIAAWLLLLPPFSVTLGGKTYVDTGAPLSQWETFSSHQSDDECLKHRDQLRQQVEKAVGPYKGEVKKGSGKEGDASQVAFGTLRERLASARCVSSSDASLRTPAASPSAK
jgi:hypothetical protein